MPTLKMEWALGGDVFATVTMEAGIAWAVTTGVTHAV